MQTIFFSKGSFVSSYYTFKKILLIRLNLSSLGRNACICKSAGVLIPVLNRYIVTYAIFRNNSKTVYTFVIDIF